MKVYIITGEASGDWYGAQIIKSLKTRDTNCQVRFWGGDNMLAESANLVKHIKDTAFMGFVEVVKNLREIKSNIKLCKADIKEYSPDIIIFIDYPGFNLRIADWAKSKSYKTVWYISPKVWAWKESRVKKMKTAIDHLFVIFPFEVEYFAKFDIDAMYQGNPLAYRIKQYRQANMVAKDAIVLMPGSRVQELKRHLGLVYNYAMTLPREKFVLPLAQGFTRESLTEISRLNLPQNIELVDDSWAALNRAKLGIIASGTSTLEAMLFDVPQVVIYKANPISYRIAKRVVKIKYISLVNILANRKVITELIQSEANLDNLKMELEKLQKNPEQLLGEYKEITAQLSTKSGQPFDALVESIYDLAKSVD